MTTGDQPTLFDAAAAQAGRDEGIARVASRNAAFMEYARRHAVVVATTRGEVTADTLREWLDGSRIVPSHFNAWGAVFSNHPRLVWSGRFRKSRLPQGHGNMQRVWVLK